jgi:uncharacterized UPF0160 family protein
MDTPSPKRPIVATHNGEFHADEIAAMSLFLETRVALGDERDWEIVRTRDPKVIAEAEAAIDVGGIHDPEKLRFDHHQDRNSEKASCGMVLDYARQIPMPMAEKAFGLWKDAADQIDQTDLGKGITEIAELVDKNNLTWLEKEGRTREQIEVMETERFHDVLEDLNKAKSAARTAVFLVSSLKSEELPEEKVREIAAEALTLHAKRGNMGERAARSDIALARGLRGFTDAVTTAKNGTTTITKSIPWQNYVLDKCLQDPKTSPSFKREIQSVYFVEDRSRPESTAWLTVSRSDDMFSPKAPFPEEWRSLRGNKLIAAMNATMAEKGIKIPEVAPEQENEVFCHGAGFLLVAPNTPGGEFALAAQTICRELTLKMEPKVKRAPLSIRYGPTRG